MHAGHHGGYTPPLMTSSLRRRAFLQALAGAATLALPRTTLAQTGPSALKLTDRITLITGTGNNVIAFARDSGTLLVDAGDAAHAAVRRGRIRAIRSTCLTNVSLSSPACARSRWASPD
jgi:hypothetical protein